MVQTASADLLVRARAGDKAAFGELLDHFRPYVRVLASVAKERQMLKLHDDSDLIQDTMVVAHEAFKSFRGTSIPEFARWLRTLTLRTVGHLARSQHKGIELNTIRGDIIRDLEQSAPSDLYGLDAQAERHEMAARVAAALERLPGDMQQVLRARSYDGLSYAELAIQMQRSEGALRVLHTRAIRQLADELKGDRDAG